jgi:mannitol-1-phosphate 5-dehydrogenase
MIPYSPFDYIHQRKLYIHNMGHAVTAYLGRLKGYNHIASAIEDPVIRQVVTSAMKDLAICLCKRHGTALEDANAYIDDLLSRFGNKQLCDTVDRVGSDVKRKLSPRDRIVGAARLCVENHISPSYLCLGIAAAIRFLLSGSKTDNCWHCPVDEILEKICEINRNDPLYSSIIPLYRAMESGFSLEDTVCMATEMLNR